VPRSKIHIAVHIPAPIMSISEIKMWIDVWWVLVRDIRFGH